ncbi:hypothetical protein MHYP_G00100570 [Metynnis hypsauchen]
MAYYCLSNIVSNDINEFWHNYNESSVDVSQDSCDSVTDGVQTLDCGAGLMLYYLVPIRGVYMTRHSSCRTSYCGPYVSCNDADGSCQCDFAEISMTTEDYYTCTGKFTIIKYVAGAVRILFLTLTLLTFVLCRRQLNVKSTAQFNLCINLLLSQLFFWFPESFVNHIRKNQVACAVLAGFQYFFFISYFTWMFIDAVLLFISAKNLTKINSRQKEMLGWKSLTVIGNIIPLITGSMSFAVMLKEPFSKNCFQSNNIVLGLTLVGLVFLISTANVILFIAIFITVTFSLKRLNSEILQRTETQADKKLIRTVLFKTMAQFFILGCPWLLSLFGINNEMLRFVSILHISQQGFFIFLVHCILNQEVRQQYRKWLHTFCCAKSPPALNDTQIMESSFSST